MDAGTDPNPEPEPPELAEINVQVSEHAFSEEKEEPPVIEY